MRVAVLDLDDLASEAMILADLVPLRERVSGLLITCYAIPNHLGPVHDLKVKYPWIIFGTHGFEHSFAECRSWTTDLALARIGRALEMGYEPLFKPPQWICDSELEEACKELGVVLHHHCDYVPQTSGLRHYSDEERDGYRAIHSHLQPNPSTDDLRTHPYFTPEYLRRFDRFDSPLDWTEVVP